MSVETGARITLRLRHQHPAAPRLERDIPDWTLDALCAQLDVETFFPTKGGSGHAAKRICADCLGRAGCLDEAMRQEQHAGLAIGMWNRHGVRGGMSPTERRDLARGGWQPGDPTPPMVMPPQTGKTAVCPLCRHRYADLDRHQAARHADEAVA